MRSNLFLLAGLASSALALPTASTELNTRTFGLISGLLDTVKDILHGTSPVHILGGISAEAAAALGGGALGCTAGSVDLEYRKKLAAWLKTGAGAHLEASVKTALLSWCEADASVDLGLDVDIRAQLGFFIPGCASIAAEADLYVSLDGVFSLAGEVLGVLSATAQATLEAAIGALAELDWKVQTGLEFCAAGGLVGDLDVEILNALKVWLNSSECTLSASLKHTLQIWISGKIGGDVIQIPSLPVGGVATIGVGKSLEALVEASGALVGSAQTSLSAFLETDVGVAIDADIKAILALIAKGSLAIDISLDKRVSLSLWLGSSDCKLTAELKGLIALWLSFGVSAGAEVSLDVSHNIITDLTGFLTGTVDALIGTHIQGLLSFILSGKGVLSISLEARAQLAALVSGSIDIEIGNHIQVIIIGWLSGCQKCCGGEIISTHTPSLPSSTPSVPKPTETPAVPTAEQPTGTPSVPSQTPGVPGEQPSGTPSVPTETPGSPTDVSPTETPGETTTPCETLTSEIVGSSTISIPGSETPGVPTDVQPTETPSAPVNTPAGPSETPVGPGETSTPCDTLTSEIVSSSTISVPGETPAVPTDVQPTETPSVPVGPSETPVAPGPSETPVAPGETSTPCETLTSEIVSSSTISVPGETPAVPTDVQPTETPSVPATETPVAPGETSTPCDTLTSEIVSSSTISVPGETPAVPTDVQPTETPSVPATETPVAPGETSTPCETLTSEVVSSSTISIPGETPAVPTDVQPTTTPAAPGTTEAPAPSGPATETPVAPGETSTPCETLTSEVVSSSTISVPGETPAVPTDVQPTETAPQPESTPCETLTSEVVSSSTISVPGETPAVPTDVQPTTTPAAPGTTEAPAPSGPASSGSCASCGLITVTVTKTVGIEACPTDY